MWWDFKVKQVEECEILQASLCVFFHQIYSSHFRIVVTVMLSMIHFGCKLIVYQSGNCIETMDAASLDIVSFNRFGMTLWVILVLMLISEILFLTSQWFDLQCT